MPSTQPKPTIIGSGVSGLLISHALSKAEIDHVLIGDPPSVGSPRLGESLGIPASVHLLTEFPDLAQFFGPKSHARAFAGDQSGGFHFDICRSPAMKLALRHWHKRCPDYALHLDRTEFDAALYAKAIASPYCAPIADRVTAVHVLPGSDKISRLDLDDTGELAVSHVFDASGHVRLLARHLSIPRRMLGVPQNVVFAHYFKAEQDTSNGGQARRDAAKQDDLDWRHGTTLLRLYREIDGFDGMAWCIPLGDKVSIGVSTPANGPEQTAEALLAQAQTRFAHYNVDYGDSFTVRSRVGRAKMEFYTHARACGSNWLLAAAAHSQIWWMTSSGLDWSAAAAVAAVPFLRKPAQTAQRYEAGWKSVERLHGLWGRIAEHPYRTPKDEDIRKLENELAWLVTARLAQMVHMEQEDRLSAFSSRFVSAAISANVQRHLPATIIPQHDPRLYSTHRKA